MCAYPFACLCDAQKIHITCVNVLCQVMLQYLKCPYIGTIHKVGGASMTVCPTHPHLAKGEFYMFLFIMQLCLSSFVYFIFLLLLLLLCFSFPWLIKFNQSINQSIKFEQILGDNRGRVMSVEVNVHNKKFHIVNLHAPNTGGGQTTSAQKLFYENLDPYLQTNNPLIIGGDFNYVEDPSRDRLPPVNHSHDRIGKNTFQQIKNVYGLSDPANEDDAIAPYFTWERNGTFSRIDRFYV